MPSAQLVFVGGGPKTTGLLLSIAAAARARREDFPETVGILVIDPFPAGGGRIWRHDQSPVLWMNSLAEDVTIFPDADASLPYPPVTGPSLAEWAASRDLTRLGVPERGLRPGDFAPRQVQAEYLRRAYERALKELPEGFSVTTVRGRATALEPVGEQYAVSYRADDGGRAADAESAGGSAAPRPQYAALADAVVLAQGFIEVDDDDESASLRARASALGLGYVAPGYTADLDLSVLPAGEDVIVRGFGLAFVDAMMMVTEGRGGRFERGCESSPAAAPPGHPDVDPDANPGDAVTYLPSGREPVLWVGSRRGVPYKSKLGYRPEGLRIGPTRWLTAETVKALRGPDGTVPAEQVLFPLLEAELATAHYVELATRYAGRTTAAAEDFVRRFEDWHRVFRTGDFDAARTLRAAWIRFAEDTVPAQEDRFDLERLDRPFNDAAFASHPEFEAAALAYARNEIARAADARYSQDSAVFFALVSAYYVTRELVSAGLFDAEDRIRLIDGRFHGLFSYIASGPPPERLHNLLALHRAGIVRFLGPDLAVAVDEGGPGGGRPPAFEATSAAHPGSVRSTWLFDARLAPVSAVRAKDPLLRALVDAGHLRIESEGGTAAKLLADPTGRAVQPDGSSHAGIFLVGPSVAASTPEAFSRPGIDARVFIDNARLTEQLRGALHPGARRGGTVYSLSGRGDD